MPGKVFVDTNILIYAHDRDAGKKHTLANSLIRKIWQTENGVISTQVIQEFYINVTRKIPNPLPRTKVRALLANYFTWQVEVNGPGTILLASEIEERYALSFWDSLIVAAASQANVEKILTEDLQSGQVIEGILIENLFLNGEPFN
jgi:predicted nucleic acid-binding protein